MKSQLLKYLKVFFVLQLLFVVFGLISTLMPNKSVRKNIEESAKIYFYESAYPKPFIQHPAHQADLFTDYLILDLIYNSSPHKPFKYLLFPQGHFQSPLVDQGIQHLKYSIDHQHEGASFVYGRYWHGSSFAYKFLFMSTNMSGVRWLNFMICSLVLFAFVQQVGNALSKPQVFLTLIGLVFINYYMVFTSLQFTPVFLITLIGSMSVIKRVNRQQAVGTLFLILGGVTCYFDLLTAPMITLGIPMLIWVALLPSVDNFFQKWKSVVGYSVLWSIGYIFSWAFKWLLIKLFTDYSIIEEIKMKIGERAGLWRGTRFDAIKANINKINLVPANLIVLVLIILMIFFFNKKGFKKAGLFLTIAIIPILWTFITANHTETHAWFTYRNLWVTVSGLFLTFAAMIRWEDVKMPVIRKKQSV